MEKSSIDEWLSGLTIQELREYKPDQYNNLIFGAESILGSPAYKTVYKETMSMAITNILDENTPVDTMVALRSGIRVLEAFNKILLRLSEEKSERSTKGRDRN